MERERVTAAHWRRAGTASKYIQHFACNPGDKFYIIARKSISGSVAKQEQKVRKAITAAGGVVIGKLVVDTTKATDDGWYSRSRWRAKLTNAADVAKRKGATLVAESTDRFIRHTDFDPLRTPDAQAMESDLYDLLEAVGDVPMMTLLPPDAPPGEVRSAQTRRGKAGRPPKGDKRRATLLPKVLALHQAGTSLRQIEADTGVPFGTVRNWVKKHA